MEPELQSLEDARRRLAEHTGQYESELRTRRPTIWWATLIGPFALTALALVGLSVLYGGSFARSLIFTAVPTFFLLGRFVILGGEEAGMAEIDFLTREELFSMVVFMDLMTATLLTFHMGFVFRIPGLGKRLSTLVEDGQFFLSTRPWMKRATFAGTVAFVMFPLAATGSVGGSIFGRLLGMKPHTTLLAIAIGSMLGCGVMYWGAGLINRYLDRQSPTVIIGGIAVIVAMILILNYRYRRLKALHRAEMSRRAGGGPSAG